MRPVIECVPNFSDGQDTAVLGALSEAVAGVPGVSLLDVHSDRWHNRSVFTFAGEGPAVAEAAYRAAQAARDRIDLRQHRGEHPRIGATDVIPFIPLGSATMADCIALADRLARRIGDELQIPTYLYGQAAQIPERENLADVRRGQFEGLRDHLAAGTARAPDFGPARVHPTAGATAVGARPILVAYNVVLETSDRTQAQGIAAAIRGASGGLPALKALGFLVDGKAQVSMNLLDIDVTPPRRAFEAIQGEAARRGIRTAHSELVGLCPERALSAEDASRIKLLSHRERHLLEPKIEALISG